jgi:cytochrome P450
LRDDWDHAVTAAAQTASSGPPTEEGLLAAPKEPLLPPALNMPPVVQALAWGVAPAWLMNRCARRFGDTFTLRFAGGIQLVHFSDPQAVKMLLTAPEEVAPKPTGGAGAPVGVLGPNSVSVLTGPEHMRQRKLLLPPFHGEHLRTHERVIVDATRRAMGSWPVGGPMRMQRHARLITLEVVMGAVFGVEAERMNAMQATIVSLMAPKQVVAGLRALVGGRSQERPTGEIGRGLDRLDAQIYAEIENRREQSDLERRSDIMSMLLVARDEDGVQMTDEEVRDELVTLLLAGHETTATTVAWAIERLVRHPDKLARLVAEIDAQSGGGGDEYLTAVINETLRVRPPQGLVVRKLTQELQVGRFLLPADTSVAVSVYATNRNPHVYEDPTAFKPERFLQNGPETYSWIPFGGGIRRCIGASLAVLEVKLILRTLLAELEPRALDGWRGRRSERMRWSHRTLIPSRGATVVWVRRSPRPSENGATSH